MGALFVEHVIWVDHRGVCARAEAAHVPQETAHKDLFFCYCCVLRDCLHFTIFLHFQREPQRCHPVALGYDGSLRMLENNVNGRLGDRTTMNMTRRKGSHGPDAGGYRVLCTPRSIPTKDDSGHLAGCAVQPGAVACLPELL